MNELDLGSVEELPEGVPTLRKGADGQRYVCVKQKDCVHVLDDRCPHEGYPLSGGTVKDGVLTCAWHNWKFEVATGDNQFGGEPVRSYPTRVEDGRVHVNVYVDPEVEQPRLERSLAGSLETASVSGAVRDALRLEALTGGYEPALAVLAEYCASHAVYGFEHSSASLADVARWIDDGTLEGAPAFAAITGYASDLLRFAPARARVAPVAGDDEALIEALNQEQRERAEAIARAMVREGHSPASALTRWLADDLTGYGHGAIFVAKASELATRLPSAAESVWASCVVSLGWATRESALPGWKASHQGIREAPAGGERPLEDVESYAAEVLASERAAVAATLKALADGVSPRALIAASARAAARRVAAFESAWETRDDAPVTILDVSHSLTFAESAHLLTEGVEPALAARFAVQAAGFVGKLHKGDGPPPEDKLGASLQDALEARDLRAALGARDDDDFIERLAHFSAHDAFVRPIFAVHAIKTTEACRRLERLDPDGQADYRAAALTVAVPRRPQRFATRTARIAEKFLADGRPPPGVY